MAGTGNKSPAVENNRNGGGYEFPAKRPVRTNWEQFLLALWDPETKQLFGRTGKSWGQLLIFYTIFYIVLAALFAICMQGLLATVSDTEPRWQLDSSIIGTNPGLGFRPISKNTAEGSLIWYNTTNVTSVEKWVSLLDDFLETYNQTNLGGNMINCDVNRPPGEGQVCIVDVEQFGPCGPSEKYGYNSSQPCVFLKLNRIYGWVPEYYNTSAELPEDMPEDLKEHIKQLELNKNETTNQIWVSCNGERPADRENVNPNFGYFPGRGFPQYFYPYKNTENYLSPVVAVQITPNSKIMISIECRAWAKNIIYKGGDRQRQGSVRFEIMKDD